jgi:hypothetical protein
LRPSLVGAVVSTTRRSQEPSKKRKLISSAVVEPTKQSNLTLQNDTASNSLLADNNVSKILLAKSISQIIPLTLTLTMMGTRRQTGMAKELDEIRQLNKKNHQAERQQQEAEEKRKRDEEEEKRRMTEASKVDDRMDTSQADEEESLGDLVSDVRNIMYGLDDTGGDEDARSPLKKRTGSSKAPSRRAVSIRQVSPNEAEPTNIQQPAAKSTSFLDTHVHKHRRTILELAILLTSEKKFEEFTQALMALLTNAQMVDPKFVINPLSPDSKGKDITSKGEISPNMTKLGEHIKISGNGNAFNKRKVWDTAGDGRKSRKSNKKDEFQDPTVYFSMIVSSDVNPKEIIDRTTHEWSRMNGVRLQIKELQSVDSETVVSFYKVSKLTPKEVLLAELRKILLAAQEKAKEDALDPDVYDFILDLDVEEIDSLPEMTLKIQTAKLRGEDLSTFNRLSNRAQFARKTWHLEVPSKFATKMKGLVELAKTYKCVEAYWGVHAHLSEVTDFKSSASEAKKQVEIAQKHTNYEVSMTAEDLVGVIDLDYASEVRHPTSGKLVGRYSLRYALLNFVKMGDGRPAIAEAHQSDIAKPTFLVVPNTPEAERMIGMMNKNLPAYLYHTMIDYGLPATFVEDLLKNSCEATMLASRHRCKWDTATKTLTTEEDKVQAAKDMAFEGAAWFKDEFGLLGHNAARNATRFAAPEALFNLDDAGSRKTIHDRHKPRIESAKKVLDLTGNKRDSASHTSSSSNSGESLNSSDEGSRSKSSKTEEDDMSATGSG